MPRLRDGMPGAGMSALLVRRCGPTGLAGGRRAEEWVLTFRPRWRGRADPLTGWWGGGDPLAGVTLRFPTRESAEAYARRAGIALEVCEPAPVADACTRHAIPAAEAAPADPVLPWLWDGRAAGAALPRAA